MGGGLTGLYSIRAIIYTYIGNTGMSKYKAKTVMEGSGAMIIAMVILGLGSLYIGYIGQTVIMGLEGEIIVGTMTK